jgi:chorismate mutase
MSTFSLILPDWNSTTSAASAAIETMSPLPLELSPPPRELQELRRRLDDIDDRLQDLLSQRFDIVLEVAAEKRSGSLAPHQPAREAEMLRRLVARNRAPLPAATLVRIWREMLAGTTRLQGNFTVAVYAAPEVQGYWDLARDHYGSHTPMLPFQSPHTVIRAVSEGQAAIGVLPLPEEEDADPWWRHLVSPDEQVPRVIARLPFGPRGNARADRGDALSIGHSAPQPTGNDRTLFATENARDISRGRIRGLLAGLGFDCTLLALCEREEVANALIEVDGFVVSGDDRLERFREQLGSSLYRLTRFGSYAVPLGEG